MAKTSAKRPKFVEPESIDIRYELHDLPTAQHKAGLAGLLLQIESMKESRKAGELPPETEIPEVQELAGTVAVIRFTKKASQDLFDDAYSAKVVEARSASKWPGAILKREESNPSPKPGEPKRLFIYDVIQPEGPFLRRYTEGDKEPWHRLWRTMLWKVPRSRPTTRTPFNNRAQPEPIPTKEGADTWKALVANEKAKADGEFSMVELAGAVMLGVQAINAELVRFENRADHDPLLHFWPLTARVFVPEMIDADGNREFVGFVLAVPDVSDLIEFNRAYRRLLQELGPKSRWGRPVEAIISLPAQGSLEFLRHLDDLATRKVLAEGPARYMAGVEFFHMVPAGQNVKMAAHGRIPPDSRLLSEYSGIRASCRNPLFLSCRLLAALRKEPWFAEFGDPLADRDWSFFVHSMGDRRRTPPAMAGFATDAGLRFKAIGERLVHIKKGTAMRDLAMPPEAVDRLVYDLVGAYVKERACGRSGVDPKDEKWWSKTAEERRDVCSKLFLEIRSRNDDDFVRHFTATLGSVPQWLKEGGYLAVAHALMLPYTEETGPDRPRTRDDVKTLTLLALSAHSRSYTPRDDADSEADATNEEDD
jgi:CRISPR-associated protein Cmx8